MPDMIALRGGFTFFIEFKRGDGGKLGVYQAQFIKKLRDLGFICAVVKNWNEFQGVYSNVTKAAAGFVQLPKEGSL